MNYKLMVLETCAILVSFLLMNMPLAFATNVNILFNGQTQATVEISPENLVNKNVEIIHEPSDITWTRIKVLVSVSSASLSKSVSKIYLFKCGTQNPVECIRSQPLEFETYIDSELAWADISERTGAGTYPQEANLLLLIKLEGDKTSWTGFWTKMVRTNYNVFNTFDYELSNVDLYANSMDMVDPIKSYIENYQMIPFNWVSKAVFRTANAIFGIGGTETDLDTSPPVLESAQPTVNYVTSINRDFYLLFPQTSSGVNNPITLNLNPSFTCGDGMCETNLGETTNNCCHDCGCVSGYYCDVPGAQPSAGVCKDGSLMGLSVLATPAPQITDCTQGYEGTIRIRIENPPSSVPSTISGTVSLNNTIYAITCTGSSAIYNCPVTIPAPVIGCGLGSYDLGPNMLNLTLNYNDGPNHVIKDMGVIFPGISVSYDCLCEDGYYCDAGTSKCKTLSSLSLGITSVTSYITDYNPEGDYIVVKAKINNPPGDLNVNGFSYSTGNITYGDQTLQGMSGSVTCSGGPETLHEYTCSIPFTIPDYTHENQYVIRDNSLTFSVGFSNTAQTVSMDLTSDFSDVTIPSYRCGDGTCNVEEDPTICCLDCGCPDTGDYCDLEKGCRPVTGVGLIVDSVYPMQLSNCREEHDVAIQARVVNPPSDAALDYYYYMQNGTVSGWELECEDINAHTGISECTLTTPSIEDCALPYYNVEGNEMNFTITFGDGTGAITKTLTTGFQNIHIVPTYACGDEVCEDDFGESADVCCIDCACEDEFGSDYYCDYNRGSNVNGTCRSKSAINLVVDSPTAELRFDSCEKSHYINVKAHIENEPSGARLEAYNAILNGSNVDYMICRKEDYLTGGGNHTYNCTIGVPDIPTCTKNSTYVYDPNSISLLISFDNGFGKEPEPRTLTSPLPRITTTQSIRSLYDITQDAIGQMQGRLDEIMRISEKLMNKYRWCLKVAKIIALATLATVALGFIGGGIGAGVSEKISMESVGNFVGRAGDTGTKLLVAWTALCHIMAEMYKVDINMQEFYIDMIKMEMCLDMIQHQMDIGDCKGREETCFTSMTTCIDFKDINNRLNDLDKIMDSVTSDAEKMSGAFEDMGKIWDGFEWTKEVKGTISVDCASAKDKYCCGHEPDGPFKEYTGMKVRLTNVDNCKDPKVQVTKSTGVIKEYRDKINEYESYNSDKRYCENMDKDRCLKEETQYKITSNKQCEDITDKTICNPDYCVWDSVTDECKSKPNSARNCKLVDGKCTYGGTSSSKPSKPKALDAVWTMTGKSWSGNPSEIFKEDATYYFVLVCGDTPVLDVMEEVVYCEGDTEDGCGTGSTCSSEFQDMAISAPQFGTEKIMITPSPDNGKIYTGKEYTFQADLAEKMDKYRWNLGQDTETTEENEVKHTYTHTSGACKNTEVMAEYRIRVAVEKKGSPSGEAERTVTLANRAPKIKRQSEVSSTATHKTIMVEIEDDDLGPNGDRRGEDVDIAVFCNGNLQTSLAARWIWDKWGQEFTIPKDCTPTFEAKDKCGAIGRA